MDMSYLVQVYLFTEFIMLLLLNNFESKTEFLLIKSIRGPFEKFVDWRQCATVMQREAVTVTPSYSDGGNVVVA
jgi:hypothetical protein